MICMLSRFWMRTVVGFHRNGASGSLLVALNVGHLQTHPVQEGRGLIRYTAPVETGHNWRWLP